MSCCRSNFLFLLEKLNWTLCNYFVYAFRLIICLSFAAQGADKKKKASKATELPLECITHGFSPVDLSNYTQQESKMIGNDQKETERIDAKNALEEFVYDMRNKLQVTNPTWHSQELEIPFL